jgi:heme A synthase
MCGEGSLADLLAGGALDPFRAPAVVDGAIVAPEGAAMLHTIHRIGSLVVAGVVIALAVRLWHPRGDLASVLAMALPIGAGAGFAAALMPSALGVTLAHNAAGAVLLASLARAAFSDTVD